MLLTRHCISLGEWPWSMAALGQSCPYSVLPDVLVIDWPVVTASAVAASLGEHQGHIGILSGPDSVLLDGLVIDWWSALFHEERSEERRGGKKGRV